MDKIMEAPYVEGWIAQIPCRETGLETRYKVLWCIFSGEAVINIIVAGNSINLDYA
jgi:hypothetical protein